MLSLKLAIVITLCMVNVSNSWFSNIYISVGVPLLAFLYVESSSAG